MLRPNLNSSAATTISLTDSIGLAAATTTVLVAGSNKADTQTAPASKAASGSTGDNQDNGSGATSDPGAAAAAAGQAQTNANAMQPVAAAIVLSVPTNSAPATDHGTAATASVSEASKGRAKIGLASLGNFVPSKTLDAKDTAASAQTSSSTNPAATANSGNTASAGGTASADTTANAHPGTADNTSGTPAPNGAPSSLGQAPSGNPPFVPAQAAGNAQTGSNNTTTRAETSSSTSSADPGGASAGQNNSNAVKASADSLPNTGFAAIAAATPSSAAATPAAAPAAAAVPVSGLPVVIAARARAGSNQFDIQLDPPELGRIDVRLDVNHDGQVTSHVTVDRQDTLDLLQSQQPQLERALEQAGLKTSDNGLQFTLRDQSFTGQNSSGGGNAQPNTAPQLVVPDADLPPVQTTQIYTQVSLRGGLDIRV